MTNLSTTTLIGIAITLTIIAGLLVAWSSNRDQLHMLSITNFDECAAAGFPIMESYPERCATPDGRIFVNERRVAPGSNFDLQVNGCAVAGCSGQLCVSSDEAGEIVTTCDYRAEYACYKEASCEPQADGRCGWTQTEKLTRCLANPPSFNESDLQVY